MPRFAARSASLSRYLVEVRRAPFLTTEEEAMLTESGSRDVHSLDRLVSSNLPFVIKAVSEAIKEYPIMNSQWDGDYIVIKKAVNISIAVATDTALFVPVIKEADTKNIAGLARAIETLTRKTREGRLTADDVSGGTFTVNNTGAFGSILSAPILNPPQVGILGMHKIQERPVAVEGQVVIRPMMYLALTYDHRVVDGREAVQFLVRVKELVEDPGLMLLEG